MNSRAPTYRAPVCVAPQPLLRAMWREQPSLLIDVARRNLDTGRLEDPPPQHWVSTGFAHARLRPQEPAQGWASHAHERFGGAGCVDGPNAACT